MSSREHLVSLGAYFEVVVVASVDVLLLVVEDDVVGIVE